MAHLLRGKQVGVQKDLSQGISPEFLVLDDVSPPHPDVLTLTDKMDYSLLVMASTRRSLLLRTIRFNLFWLSEPMILNSVLA